MSVTSKRYGAHSMGRAKEDFVKLHFRVQSAKHAWATSGAVATSALGPPIDAAVAIERESGMNETSRALSAPSTTGSVRTPTRASPSISPMSITISRCQMRPPTAAIGRQTARRGSNPLPA
eukprot:scaffold3769_cov37-Tisochrysis_lutea.AAC.1